MKKLHIEVEVSDIDDIDVDPKSVAEQLLVPMYDHGLTYEVKRATWMMEVRSQPSQTHTPVEFQNSSAKPIFSITKQQKDDLLEAGYNIITGEFGMLIVKIDKVV